MARDGMSPNAQTEDTDAVECVQSASNAAMAVLVQFVGYGLAP